MNALEQITKLFGNNPEYRIEENGNTVSVERYVFKDEYEVPMFKREPYWWVNTDEDSGLATYEVMHTVNCIVSDTEYPITTKKFASKESAERWIKENKPRTPIHVDPENGDEFFADEGHFWFSKTTYGIEGANKIDAIEQLYVKDDYSKSYNTREKCEIALCRFLANKYNYRLTGKY